MRLNVVTAVCCKFYEPIQNPGRKLLGGQSKTGPFVIGAGLHRRVESEPSPHVGRPSSVSEIGTRDKPRKHQCTCPDINGGEQHVEVSTRAEGTSPYERYELPGGDVHAV